jgi:5-methylcytosine-specific restriction endonuclease McrA
LRPRRSINITGVGTRVSKVQSDFEHYVHNKRVEKAAAQKAASRHASKWSKEVMVRDAMTCQVCGSHENLAAHHVFSRRRFPTLRSNPDNGITLCGSCHAKWHNLKKTDKSLML